MTKNELDRSCYTPIIVVEEEVRKEEDDDGDLFDKFRSNVKEYSMAGYDHGF